MLLLEVLAEDPARPRELIEQLHLAWREARAETAAAYRHWCTAPTARRGEAYAVYVAAADREAAAEWAARLSNVAA